MNVSVTVFLSECDCVSVNVCVSVEEWECESE